MLQLTDNTDFSFGSYVFFFGNCHKHYMHSCLYVQYSSDKKASASNIKQVPAPSEIMQI